MALQEAGSELKELKEVVESVSTKNYVFAILYYSNYTVFALDSSFKSCSIRLSFTIIFVASFFLHHSSYSLPYPSCSYPPPPRPLPPPPPPEPCKYPCLILYCILYLQEKRNFKEYMLQMASETEVYRKHIERLQMVNHLTDLL